MGSQQQAGDSREEDPAIYATLQWLDGISLQDKCVTLYNNAHQAKVVNFLYHVILTLLLES